MSAAPKWFRPVAVVALLWNLAGAAAYLADVTISPEALAKMTEAQRAMYAARPAWFVAAYATAVWFGTAGSLGLVLARRWAQPVLLVSFLGLLVQDAAILTRPEMKSAGGAVIILQSVVLVIGGLLIGLARKANAAGWTR